MKLGFLRRFSRDLGIDLGTTNTLISMQGKGIVIHEPSCVAVNMRTGQVLSVGEEARTMIGRCPAHIHVTNPLERGIIADFEVTEKMLRYFFEKIHRDKKFFSPRPRVVMAVPLDVTEVERKAVGDAAISAGASEVFLIECPLAAAMGIGLPVSDPIGSMIVDLGGGTTEISVISLNGIVTSKSIPIAGDELNKNIIQYARDVFNLLLGERVAEEVKLKAGSAIHIEKRIEIELRGRDLVSGLPREITVNDGQIREAIARSIKAIIDHIKSILEITPPELVADIYKSGIVLTGGGSLLQGIDQAISEGTGLPVRIADDPLASVVKGCAIVLQSEKLLADMTVSAASLMS